MSPPPTLLINQGWVGVTIVVCVGRLGVLFNAPTQKPNAPTLSLIATFGHLFCPYHYRLYPGSGLHMSTQLVACTTKGS